VLALLEKAVWGGLPAFVEPEIILMMQTEGS
jgi:hypothetical protein